jgi:hypothetical protein
MLSFRNDLLRGALLPALAALDGLMLQTVIEAVPLLAKRSKAGPTMARWVVERWPSLWPLIVKFDSPQREGEKLDACRRWPDLESSRAD